MVYRGRVQNGVVVLEGGAKLEEGQPVSVRLLRSRATKPAKGTKREGPIPSLYERYKSFIGIAKGLPRDFASQHEHYLYGTPKRKVPKR